MVGAEISEMNDQSILEMFDGIQGDRVNLTQFIGWLVQLKRDIEKEKCGDPCTFCPRCLAKTMNRNEPS